MPSITLNFTVEKGLRVLNAFKAHDLSPLINPSTGEPYTELQLIKRGIIELASREVFEFEKSEVMEIAHAVYRATEDSVVKEPDIAS